MWMTTLFSKTPSLSHTRVRWKYGQVHTTLQGRKGLWLCQVCVQLKCNWWGGAWTNYGVTCLTLSLGESVYALLRPTNIRNAFQKRCSLSVVTSLYLVTLFWAIHGAIQYLSSARGCGITVTILRARGILFFESEGVVYELTVTAGIDSDNIPILEFSIICEHLPFFTWVEADTASAACPSQPGNLEMISMILAAFI